MAGYRFVLAMVAVALVGGLVGGVIALAISDGGEDEHERGTVVRLGGQLGFVDGVWCSAHHRFCIPEFEKPEEARAFYMVDTNTTTRRQGCPVEWRLDLDIARYADEETAERLGPGGFRANCTGNRWLRNGDRLFGPAPRDLDEFEMTFHTETRSIGGEATEVTWFEVDTRTLICGDWASGITPDDIPDPECALAPPFD